MEEKDLPVGEREKALLHWEELKPEYQGFLEYFQNNQSGHQEGSIKILSDGDRYHLGRFSVPGLYLANCPAAARPGDVIVTLFDHELAGRRGFENLVFRSIGGNKHPNEEAAILAFAEFERENALDCFGNPGCFIDKEGNPY